MRPMTARGITGLVVALVWVALAILAAALWK